MVTKQETRHKNLSIRRKLVGYRRAISRYMTGVTIRDSKVDEINPPMITQASGA